MRRFPTATPAFRHADWLSLIETSGLYFSVEVLERAFPQGLESVETPRRQRLRAAYEEWREAVDERDPQLDALHGAWIRMVLEEALEYESVLVSKEMLGEDLALVVPESTAVLKPDFVVRRGDDQPRLLIQVYPPETDLEKVKANSSWATTPLERAVLLCRATGVRSALLTNGERWMVVHAPVGGISGYAAWYARLWWQESVTFRAFTSLLGVRRNFGPPEDTLDALLEESSKHRETITDTLGEQVKRAVEVLVQALDRADHDRDGELLRDVKPADLYEAGLTIMMRSVFVLCAEERGLLLLNDPVYDGNYAIYTLRSQLEDDANRFGEEILERRYDAWSRLLAVFRIVYGGIDHVNLRLPALGGSLFDPDRFAFLEGRAAGSSWRDTPAAPLPIDNRTVLMLLRALQVLEHRSGAQLLSYRALDVEQIGHVYEGLLEHTVARMPEFTLGLKGSQKAKNPNLSLARLESARMDGGDTLLELLIEHTQRSKSALTKELSRPVEDALFGKLLRSCDNQQHVAARVKPFVHLLRTDNWDEPLVYRQQAFAVTLGSDRRETGTHYTPKVLTEQIVTTTLEPIVYVGPAEGTPREQWQLKSPAELLELKICDPAMGSGAFLVQVCRWLSERIVESWAHAERDGQRVTVDGETKAALDDLEPMPSDLDERLLIARRLVAERCLYGVDINPLAVELAKLSIWLTTLAKGRPFGFLDHNLRSGDSLLGVHRLEQLLELRLNPNGTNSLRNLFSNNVEIAINEALKIRQGLRNFRVRDIKDIESMTILNDSSREKLKIVYSIADEIVNNALSISKNDKALNNSTEMLIIKYHNYFSLDLENQNMQNQTKNIINNTRYRYFHWLLEFPEVILNSNGFDAILTNPPFVEGNNLPENIYKYLRFLKLSSINLESNKANSFTIFIERGIDLLKDNSNLGIVIPKTFLKNDQYTKARERMLKCSLLKTVVDLPVDIFRSASVETCVLVTQKSLLNSQLSHVINIIKFASNEIISKLSSDSILSDEKLSIRISNFSESHEMIRQNKASPPQAAGYSTAEQPRLIRSMPLLIHATLPTHIRSDHRLIPVLPNRTRKVPV